MLAKEKRFAVRSIAVGIVATGLVAALFTWQVKQADIRLDALRNSALATPKVPHELPDGAAFSDIAKAETEASQYRDNRLLISLLTFVAFCLPLAWYFLLVLEKNGRLQSFSRKLSNIVRSHLTKQK